MTTTTDRPIGRVRRLVAAPLHVRVMRRAGWPWWAAITMAASWAWGWGWA